MAPYILDEYVPGYQYQSEAELEEAVRNPAGTCKMGNDASAVVTNELKVHGIDKLRVVDASIMPEIVSGNTNAPTIMIAEKAADTILGRQQA